MVLEEKRKVRQLISARLGHTLPEVQISSLPPAELRCKHLVMSSIKGLGKPLVTTTKKIVS